MSIKIIRNFMDVAPVRKKSLAIYTWESTISILGIGYTQNGKPFWGAPAAYFAIINQLSIVITRLFQSSLNISIWKIVATVLFYFAII